MTTRKTENNDRERYLLLRGMLEDRRREIHEKLRSLREAIPAASHDVRDAEEQSVDEFVQEVDLALMQMKSETLKKIDAAILRLEQGSYGRCQECDQEIACGAPARAAVRGAVPRLPGADRGPGSLRARGEGLRAAAEGARERHAAHRRPRLRRPTLSDERKPDFESDGVHEIDLDWSSPTEIGILPLRDTLLFPQAVLPLAVARESSVTLVNEAVKERKVIGVLTQRDPAVDEPLESDLYPIGTLTHIHKMFRFPDGSLRLVVQGLQRFRILQVSQYRPYLKARVELIKETVPADQEVEVKALAQSALSFFQRVVELSPTLSDELATVAGNLQKPEQLADLIAGNLPTLSTAQKQEFLETIDVHARIERVNKVLVKDLEVLEVGSKIQSQVKSELQKNQREYYLREQMKAIQKELGDSDDQQRETSELREKIEAAGMPEEAKKEALRELERLSRMAPGRGRVHGDAHLPRLGRLAALEQAHRGRDRPDQGEGSPRQRPLRPREGEGPHPRVPGGAQDEARHQGPDPLLRRAPRASARPASASRSPRRSGASSIA